MTRPLRYALDTTTRLIAKFGRQPPSNPGASSTPFASPRGQSLASALARDLAPCGVLGFRARVLPAYAWLVLADAAAHT